MSKTVLSSSAREADVYRFDDAGGAVRSHQQRVVEATPFHVLEECGHCLGIFLRSRHQMQQYPAALNRKAPGRENWFALGAGAQPFGDAVNKQIGDLVLAGPRWAKAWW